MTIGSAWEHVKREDALGRCLQPLLTNDDILPSQISPKFQLKTMSQELHGAFMSEDEEASKAALLSGMQRVTWTKEASQALRLGGGVPRLLQLLQLGAWSPLEGPQLQLPLAALEVTLECAKAEVSFKETLIREGAARKLEKFLTAAGGPPPSPEARRAQLLAVQILVQMLNNGAINRAPCVDELFRLGVIGRLSQVKGRPALFVDKPPARTRSQRIFGAKSDHA